MKISAIVVTRNEGAELRRTVENLRDTLPARSEIVIVDDASTDGSTAGFRRAIKAPGIGVARARNLGAARSRGDVLVFADGHIRLDKLWWQPLADVVEDRQVAAVAPGGMWSLTCVGSPAHSYMRKIRASESSAFLMAVRVTLGFSMLAQECSAGSEPMWGKTCSALRGSLSS